MVRAIRAALLAAIGFLLAYALYLYYIGIFFRVRPSPFRLMLPGLFLLGVLGICYAVLRQVLQIRRDIAGMRSEEERGKSGRPEEADGKES